MRTPAKNSSRWARAAQQRIAALCGFLIASVVTVGQEFVAPSPAPVAPLDWDVFEPPALFSGSPLSDAPRIAEWTRVGTAGDTLVVTGENFSRASAGTHGSDTEFAVYSQITPTAGALTPAAIQRLDGDKAAITLPLVAQETGPRGMFLVWPRNRSGYGPPIAINRTETWWIDSGTHVHAGQTVSIYGRSLSHRGGTARSWVYLAPIENPALGQWATVTAANPYRVQFVAPAGLAQRRYAVWVHNGHGGRYGWSGPLHVTVAAAVPWSSDGSGAFDPHAPATFNVKASHFGRPGARGDGVTDDTKAIRRAWETADAYRAANPGARPTLYFPAGTYLLRYGIPCRSSTRYLGDGKDLTILKCHRQFSQPARPGDGLRLGLFFGNGGVVENLEIAGLTLDANGHFRRPYAGYKLLNGVWDQGREIHLRNLRVRMADPESGVEGAVYLHGATHVSVRQCEFISAGLDHLFILGGRNLTIDECTFYSLNNAAAAIHLAHANEVSVTRCVVRDFDSRTPGSRGINRLVIARNGFGSQRHAYIAHNTTIDSGPIESDGADMNSGETVLCEGDSSILEADAPLHAAATSVTLLTSGNDAFRSDLTAVITTGKGIGQARHVIGQSTPQPGTRTFQIDPPWTVVPDASSRVLIGHFTSRWVVYQNHFAGRNYARDFPNTSYYATSGIQPYGGCIDWTGDSNTIVQMRRGLAVHAHDYYSQPERPNVTTNPALFHLYVNNWIDECREGIHLSSSFSDSAGAEPGSGCLGIVFRKNTLTNSPAALVLQTDQTNIPGTGIDFGVFDRNLISNTSHGMVVGLGRVDRLRNILLLGNGVSARGVRPPGTFGARSNDSALQAALVGNTWTGFESTYAGPAPSASVIELPIRRVTLSAGAAVLPIVNAGTAQLEWIATASPSASWLRLDRTKGTLAAEQTTALTVSGSPTGLAPGTYTAIVVIAPLAPPEIAQRHAKAATITFIVQTP